MPKLNYPQDYSSHDLYITYDLCLATTLITLGYELLDVEREYNNKSQFIFFKKDKIDKDFSLYLNNKLKLNPRKLFEAQKILKNCLYQK